MCHIFSFEKCLNGVGTDEVSTRLSVLATNGEIPYQNVASKHL